MQEKGFDLESGEKGSDRKHLETREFKKQTLEKEIDFLEKDLAIKKVEFIAYSDTVEPNVEIPAEKEMQDVEVPTGEKSIFGLGKEITRTERKQIGRASCREREKKE